MKEVASSNYYNRMEDKVNKNMCLYLSYTYFDHFESHNTKNTK